MRRQHAVERKRTFAVVRDIDDEFPSVLERAFFPTRLPNDVLKKRRKIGGERLPGFAGKDLGDEKRRRCIPTLVFPKRFVFGYASSSSPKRSRTEITGALFLRQSRE